MCDFLTIQCICEDYVDSYYPDILRTLEELDVIFAHAHLTERRPTLVAAELPKLSDHQVQEMTERYDIHGGAASEDPEAVGAPVNTGGAIDTSLPPVHPLLSTTHQASTPEYLPLPRVPPRSNKGCPFFDEKQERKPYEAPFHTRHYNMKGLKWMSFYSLRSICSGMEF